MEIRIRKRNQNKFRKMLKKYRQYIIVGVAAVVIIIICIVILITSGVKYKKSNSSLNDAQRKLAKETNPENKSGTLKDALAHADVFIGVSAPGLVSPEMIKSMNRDACVFPLANPTPEIMPDEAIQAGARIVGTGRSDFANQINNVLVFPGLFRGALDVRAIEINEEMKLAAAEAIASLITVEERNENYIIPNVFDKRVAEVVAKAVAKTAKETGVAQI